MQTMPSTDQRRESILSAARAIFARDGYASATVDAVAGQAGIAKGTVYLYFRSKEEIYLAALLADGQALSAKVREEMSAARGLRDKVRALLRARLDYLRSHEEFLRLYLSEYGSLFQKGRNVPNEFQQLFRDNLTLLAGHIEKAIEAGEIRRVEAGATASAIFDLSRGLLEKRLLGWTEFDAPDEVEFVLDLLWSGMSKSPRARQAS